MHVPVLRQAGHMLPWRAHPRQAAARARIPQRHAPGLDPRVDRLCDQNTGQGVECVAANYGQDVESYCLRTKPTMSFVAFMVSAAMARARSAPSISIESTWPGSATSRFISAAIGARVGAQRPTDAVCAT